MLTYKRFIQLVFICIFSTFLLRANTPFIKKDDANSVRYALFAKNITRLSIKDHKLANLNFVSDQGVPDIATSKKSFYLDHPPLITWLSAISFKFLGNHYYSFRLVPILSSLLSLYFLYKILKLQEFSPFLITIFITIFTFNPLFVEHGETLNFEPTTFLFITTAYYYLLKFTKLKINNYFKLFIFFWILALLTDWPAYFALPFFYFLTKKLRKEKRIILMIPIIVFLINMIWFSSINFTFVKNFILDRILFKSDIYLDCISYFKHQVSFSIMNFTHLIPISLMGILFLIQEKKNHAKYLPFFSFYLIIGFLNVILFLPWSDTHRFWTYYLIPAITFPAAIFIELISNKIKINSIRSLFFAALLFLYIPLSFFQINNRRNSKIISLEELNNINLLKDRLSNEDKIYSQENIYQTHDGILLRYHLDKQLNIINESELDNQKFSIKKKSEACKQDQTYISYNYKICLN